MKSLIYSLLFAVVIIFTNTGCIGTIYSATVDERNISTIANDTSIELAIMKKLTEKESGDLLDVSITSYEGKVFIVGEYTDSAQKSRILIAAKSVEGVKSVSSYMIKENKQHKCSSTDDITITAKVKSKLIGDKTIWSTNVHVSTIQCQVVLWGTVGTKAEVTKSINHAKNVVGVSSVKSFLKSAK